MCRGIARGTSRPQYRLRVGEFGCSMTSRKPVSKSSPSSRRSRRNAGSTTKASAARTVALAEVKDDLSRYLRIAEQEEVVITRHGRPAGVLSGLPQRKTG